MSHHRAPEPGPPTRGPHGPPPGHQLAPDHARSRQPVGSWAAWAPPPLAEPDRGWARLPRPAVGTRDIETPPDPILYAAPTGHYSRDRHVSLPRTWTAPEPLVARRPVLPLVRPPTSPWARDFALDTVRGLPQPERTLYPPPIARLHLPPSAEARVTDDAPTRIPAVGVPRSESAVPASDTPIPWREWFNQYSGVGSPPNTPNVPGLPGFGDILPRRAEAAHLIAPTAPSAQYHGLSTAPGSFDRSDPRVQFPFERLTRPQAVETPIEPRTSRETVDPPPRPPDDLDSPLNSGTLISPVTPFAASDVSTKLDKGELPAGIYSYRSNLRHPDSKRSKRLRRLSFDKEYHPSRRSRKDDEKHRREAFNSELQSLALSIPGMENLPSTRISIVVHAREYVQQLQERESRLRTMLVNSRRGQGGTDAEILDEIEKELEKAIEGNVDDADESAQAELKSDQDLASPLNKE